MTAGSIEYSLTKSRPDGRSSTIARQGLAKALRVMSSITAVSVPEGQTVAQMNELDAVAVAAKQAAVTNNPHLREGSSQTPVESNPDSGMPIAASGMSEGENGDTGALEIGADDALGSGDKSKGQEQGKKVLGARWKEPDSRILALRREAKESGVEYERVRAGYKGDQYAWEKE
jgi:hypothetical protein